MYEQLLKDKYLLREDDIIREIDIESDDLYDASNTITARVAVVKDTDDHHLLQFVIIDTRFSKDDPEIYAPKFACKHMTERDTTWLARVVVSIIARGITNANNSTKKEMKKRFSDVLSMTGMKL